MPHMLNVKPPTINGGIITWVNGYRKLMGQIMQFMTLVLKKVSNELHAMTVFIPCNSLVLRSYLNEKVVAPV
jgi:hypothetical protein